MARILTRQKRQPGELLASDRWRTPLPLFDALHAEFSFMIDLAASAADHLTFHWLGPGPCADDRSDGDRWHEDALACNWSEIAWEIVRGAYHKDEEAQFARGLVWGFLNPPYSADLIKDFAEACAAQTQAEGARIGVAALLPDTHDTRWYRHLRWAAEIRRIPHRVPYLTADGVTKAGAMFPSCVAIFRPQPGVRHPQPRIVEWSWRTE